MRGCPVAIITRYKYSDELTFTMTNRELSDLIVFVPGIALFISAYLVASTRETIKEYNRAKKLYVPSQVPEPDLAEFAKYWFQNFNPWQWPLRKEDPIWKYEREFLVELPEPIVPKYFAKTSE